MPQAGIRQGNSSIRSDTMNAGMTSFRRLRGAFLTPRLAASEARHDLEHHRTNHHTPANLHSAATLIGREIK